MKPSPESPPLEIYLLGVVDFQEVQALQRRLVYDVEESEPPRWCFASTRRRSAWDAPAAGSTSCPTTKTLRGLGIKVHWVNRGGGCVLHLPGQLAAYLAMPLQRAVLPSDLCRRLHRVILEVLDEFDLHGTVRADLPGVFLGQARVASVGVAVSRWIAYHGFTLNVGPYLDLFDILDEPGMEQSSTPPDLDGVAPAAAHLHAQGPRGVDPPGRGRLRFAIGITSTRTIP